MKCRFCESENTKKIVDLGDQVPSNFNLWKSIIEEANDGLLVDPLNSKEIANAIDFLYRNKEIASEMGFNGQRKVHKKYNWNFEEKKLITFYRKIIDS